MKDRGAFRTRSQLREGKPILFRTSQPLKLDEGSYVIAFLHGNSTPSGKQTS